MSVSKQQPMAFCPTGFRSTFSIREIEASTPLSWEPWEPAQGSPCSPSSTTVVPHPMILHAAGYSASWPLQSLLQAPIAFCLDSGLETTADTMLMDNDFSRYVGLWFLIAVYHKIQQSGHSIQAAIVQSSPWSPSHRALLLMTALHYWSWYLTNGVIWS